MKIVGVEKMLLRILQTHVADQTGAALTALADMDAALVLQEVEPSFWHDGQSFLAATANVSKLLWGIKGKGERERYERRRELRESLLVDDRSPLRTVAMRNHFEHLDERIFDWWDTSVDHNLADGFVGPDDFIGGLSDLEKFRQFNPVKRELVFWGERYDVAAVHQALGQLHTLAVDEAARNWWAPDGSPRHYL